MHAVEQDRDSKQKSVLYYELPVNRKKEITSTIRAQKTLNNVRGRLYASNAALGRKFSRWSGTQGRTASDSSHPDVKLGSWSSSSEMVLRRRFPFWC